MGCKRIMFVYRSSSTHVPFLISHSGHLDPAVPEQHFRPHCHCQYKTNTQKNSQSHHAFSKHSRCVHTTRSKHSACTDTSHELLLEMDRHRAAQIAPSCGPWVTHTDAECITWSHTHSYVRLHAYSYSMLPNTQNISPIFLFDVIFNHTPPSLFCRHPPWPPKMDFYTAEQSALLYVQRQV